MNEIAALLRDFGQGASNAAASNVSGPVDLLAWALRKGGVPVPSNPILGSEWMRQKGLLADPRNKIAGLLGEAAGLSAPIAAAAKAPQIARGLLAADDVATAGANRMADHFERTGAAFKGPPNQRGAIVWHGSPHKFDAFDASKIGTGEGAQAYGHGLYFADNPGVAKSYRDNLSAGNDPRDWISNIASVLGKNKKTSPQDVAAEFRRYGQTASLADNQDVVTLAKRMADGYEWNPSMGETWTNDAMTAMQRLDAMLPKSPPGSLYKVDLPDEKIARMLDWDKPLQKQAPQVQQAIKARLKDLGYSPSAAGLRAYHIEHGGFADATGETLAKKFFGDTPEAGAAFMRQQGIPGIRYLDGGSRGAGTGTSNYVVFPGEESALRILERNGNPINALVQALKGPR